MEKGFYHPQRGYWQVTGEVLQSVIDKYPNGTIEVPVKPSSYHQWRNGVWVEVLPTLEEIIAKNEARIERSKQEFDNQNSVNNVLLKIGFQQENRIRALEGAQAVTAAQFRTWVESQIE